MKILSKCCFFMAAMALFVALFLTSIDLNSFDRGFYKREYTKLNTAQEIGMSQDDLDHTTEVLLDYVQGKRADLAVTATVHGTDRAVFNEKEILHMVDVRVLYQNAMGVKNIAWMSFAILVLLGFIASKKSAILRLSEMFLKALMSVGIVVATLGFYALIDFDSFWIQFHYIFFTNELFFLDPKTDILIQMVPSQFFFDLVFRIAITFIISMVVVWGGSMYLKKKKA